MVSRYKQKRYDPLSKTIPTKLFNATARKISGIHNLHDFNCGLKAYRKEVVKNIEVYGEMHRYIPYLAKNAGIDKIGEKVVHRQEPDDVQLFLQSFQNQPFLQDMACICPSPRKTLCSFPHLFVNPTIRN